MTCDAVGGVWTYAVELARALSVFQVEVVLAVMGPPPTPSQRLAAAEPGNVWLEVGDYRLEWMDEPWSDVDAAGRWLVELARAHAVDVVHLNGYAHAVCDFGRPVLSVAHSCVLSWWRAVKGEAAPSRYHEYRRRVAAGLQAATEVVAPTWAMFDCLVREYGLRRSGAIIANGLGPAPALDGGVAPGIPTRAAPPAQPFILTAGRLWDEAKNLSAVAACAPQLPWPVYVAGDLPMTGTSADLRGLTRLGRLARSELLWWMRAASVYVLPARYEPFGLSALEAARAGCALVLGDIPSLREVWGDAAVYVDPDEVSELACAIEELVRDDARRYALGRRAEERARRHTAEGMARAYVSLYARSGPLAVAAGDAP